MKAYLSPLAGAAVWLGVWLSLRPGPFDVLWARWLLMLAPLVLVPLGLTIIPSFQRVAESGVTLPAAALLCWSLVLPPGPVAAMLATPWLIVTGLVAGAGCLHAYRHRGGPLSEICVAGAMLFLFIGGGWAVLDRLALRPLEFEPVIVLLTAIHFHYAGFVLPLAVGLALRVLGGPVARAAGMLVLAGVPLVAVGITATQLGFPKWLESIAALTLVTGATLTAWLYCRLAGQPDRLPVVRGLWGLAGLSLLLSMLLAALYGLRFYLPVASLDIPWMRALHGSANALGFALPALLGWSMVKSRESN